jgi:hypothetical protein
LSLTSLKYKCSYFSEIQMFLFFELHILPQHFDFLRYRLSADRFHNSKILYKYASPGSQKYQIKKKKEKLKLCHEKDSVCDLSNVFNSTFCLFCFFHILCRFKQVTSHVTGIFRLFEYLFFCVIGIYFLFQN